MNEFNPDDTEGFIAGQLVGSPVVSHPDDPVGVPPVDWRHLSSGQSRLAWASLREWVEWFTVRYDVPISIVPNCWWRHGHLVEELSALHTAHLAAFDSSDTGDGPIGWHERLTLAQSRLQRAGAGCTREHNEVRPRSWDAATDEAEWDAWIDQSHAR